MRKILIMLLIIILLTAFGIMLTSGISIGSFTIPSIEQIIDENNDLDTQIAELSTAINSDYASALSSLSSSVSALQTAKQRYQDTITYSTEEEIAAANQTEKYELGYLWTKIGLYATNNNVVMQANVSTGSLSGLYNISFTAIGEYISISEFIYSIENDSNLGFKIEEFTLVPYSEDTLQATFIIRNIAIDEDSLSSVISSTTQSSTEEDEDEESSIGVDVPSVASSIQEQQS